MLYSHKSLSCLAQQKQRWILPRFLHSVPCDRTLLPCCRQVRGRRSPPRGPRTTPSPPPAGPGLRPALPGSLFPSQASGFRPPSKRGNSSGVGSRPFLPPAHRTKWHRRRPPQLRPRPPAMPRPPPAHTLTSWGAPASPPQVPPTGGFIRSFKSLLWTKVLRTRETVPSSWGGTALVPRGGPSSEAVRRTQEVSGRDTSQ